MSIHKSLKSKMGKSKNVLTRIERLKLLGNADKVLGLPKNKIIRMKIKKGKKEDKNEINP